MTHIRLSREELEQHLGSESHRNIKLSEMLGKAELLLSMALETMKEMDDASDTDIRHLFSDFEDEYSDYQMFRE